MVRMRDLSFLMGRNKTFRHISDSEKTGIAIIYQELALVPEMTVYENIFSGARTGFRGPG